MKDIIAESFVKLFEEHDYNTITVTMICQAVPISRTSFYRYFSSKEEILLYYVQSDYERNCLPIFRFHIKEQGTKCFFSYIREHKSFYIKLYEIDQGDLLFRCLKAAYYIGFTRRSEYSRPVRKRITTFDPAIFFEYSCSGIAGVVVSWVRNGMKVSDEKMAADLYIMFSEPLGKVRDYYT